MLFYLFYFIPCFLRILSGGLLFCSLNLIRTFVEISSFPIDGLLEDYRNIRMGLTDLLNEWEESLFNNLCFRIGEGVEHQSIDICIAKDLAKVWLHSAVSAASKAEELESGPTHELHRIAHTWPAGAYAMCEARSKDTYSVAER